MIECRMEEPPNPPELAQAIAAMLTGRDEQTALLRELVQQGRAPRPEPHHQFLGIRSSWGPSCRCFTRPTSRWRPTASLRP